MTLGLAIRASQSIGLHVDDERTQESPEKGRVSQELRRRIWYSAYALDRLLSLQLGRPPAISNRDCSPRLPSRVDDMDFDLVCDTLPSDITSEPRSCDYFVAVIQFSSIIGHVLRDLYGPSSTYSEEMLNNIDRIENELADWKSRLPRWLRFDRGHLFEASSLYRRQRNMLGIKYHHLRALTHRPCLCLPWLQHNHKNIGSLLEAHSQRVVNSERICVEEAQKTARMLHDIPDKRALVEDFPWWQMIPCLICASSILLVMRVFSTSDTPIEHLTRDVLGEDADICLRVFDALSANSDAARSARDMLHSLRASEVNVDKSILLRAPRNAQSAPPKDTIQADDASTWDSSQSLSGQTILPGTSQDNFFSQWTVQDWPSELANSMDWSSQYVTALQANLSW